MGSLVMVFIVLKTCLRKDSFFIYSSYHRWFSEDVSLTSTNMGGRFWMVAQSAKSPATVNKWPMGCMVALSGDERSSAVLLKIIVSSVSERSAVQRLVDVIALEGALQMRASPA